MNKITYTSVGSGFLFALTTAVTAYTVAHVNKHYDVNVSVTSNHKLIVNGVSGDNKLHLVSYKKAFVPKTKLGKALWDRRLRIIKAGETLRPASQILEDLANSRKS